ncbi:MAG TPA: nicotinate-nucleotide adenylyltransferase [Terriglobales bacterium]|nr:nicotinate-nucleotide adenylyltransferase [Terriglobales bacterium]
MRIALFGGTFDPVHRGHLAVARAAIRRYRLDRVLFAPADLPPHKLKRPLTPFFHRLAMLALAVSGEGRFVVSAVDAAGKRTRASYSIETVRRLKRRLGKRDRLFFLIGMDAFKDIATWYRPEALLKECDFIVASRPGFSLKDAFDALPLRLKPKAIVDRKRHAIALGKTTVYLMGGVRVPVSATEVRAAARRGKSLATLVPARVAAYIRRAGLYKR